MKKLFIAIACLAIISACNNSADTNATTTSDSANDTMGNAVIPPPVPLDTASTQSDSAKVKRAMRK